DLVFEKLIGLEAEPTKKLYKLVDKKNKMEPDKFSAQVLEITASQEKADLFEAFVSLNSVEELKAFVNKQSVDEETFNASVKPLLDLFDLLSELNLKEYVKLEPSVVRGLDYYTGMVFEIFDKHPDNRRAIAGGGAYANLLQIFNEPPLEGVGIGLGEVPLTDFLQTHKLAKDFSKPELDYLVAYLVPEAERAAMALADGLRQQSKKVELFFGEAKPKKIVNYEDKKNFAYVCLIGEEELKNDEEKVKDLATRTD